MTRLSISLTAVALAIALGGCNQSPADRTTSVPSGVDRTAAVQHLPTGPSAPPAPAERGPVPPNANAMAPGTDAAQAFAGQSSSVAAETEKAGPSSSPPNIAGRAEEAAARASDTASADAAKKEVENSVIAGNATGASPTARDTEGNSPRHGTLTKQQEVNELPKAGQVNNHSSTALEKDSGR